MVGWVRGREDEREGVVGLDPTLWHIVGGKEREGEKGRVEHYGY